MEEPLNSNNNISASQYQAPEPDSMGLIAELKRKEARHYLLKKQLFGGSISIMEPITLELGCGHGHFLSTYAKAHPHEFCLGADIMNSRLLRAEKKRLQLHLNNLHFVKAEALELLNVWPNNLKISKAYLLFLDPWPKQRHHKNRLLNPSFLDLIADKMKAGAHLYFRTDHLGYFQWARKHIDKHSKWEVNENLEWGFEATSVFQSKAPSYFSLVAQYKST